MVEPVRLDSTLAALRASIPAWTQHWGLRICDAQLVKVRENAVFRLQEETGRAYAMRVHRQGYHDPRALRSELQWMAALGQAGLEVPTPVPTLAGRPFAKFTVEGHRRPWLVDVFNWIDGHALGTSEAGLVGKAPLVRASYFQVGASMARLHQHACDWTPPRGFRRHHWDAEGLVGDQPLWGRFWEFAGLRADQRQLLLRARDVARRGLADLAPGTDVYSDYGLIHADLVPENILVSQDGCIHIIDFDDAGFGWHLFDLATALFFIQDDPCYHLARESLLLGYRSQRALPENALRPLPLFLAARAFSYLGWVHTRAASPSHMSIAPRLVALACQQAERLLVSATVTDQAATWVAGLPVSASALR